MRRSRARSRARRTRAGARYVDVRYRDQHVRRAMIEFGPDEALEHTPDWLKTRYRHDCAATRCIATTGDPEPDLLADLDGERVGRARMSELNEIIREQMIARAFNWTGVAYPNEGWAEQVFGEPDVERLWEAVAFCTRLDEDDPVAAWREHMARLEARAAAAERAQVRRAPLPRAGHRLHDRAPAERALDVGALPHRGRAASTSRTCRPRRSSRRPTPGAPRGRHLDAAAGAVRRRRRGLQADGRGRPDRRRRGDARRRGRPRAARERRGRRTFGEVALVDGDSRVGQTGLTFFDTLYDENATCHIAYGFGDPGELRRRARRGR